MPAPSRTSKLSRRGGYCTTANLMKIISPVTSGTLCEGDKITAKMLEDDFGINRAEVFLVKAAGRNLQFLDSRDCVTKTLVQLAHATEDEYRAKLEDILKRAYKDIFERIVDPAHCTQQELRDAFRQGNYQPGGMHTKMIALFKGLYREASLILDENTTPHTVSEMDVELHSTTPQEALVPNLPKSLEGVPLMVESSQIPQMNGSVSMVDDAKAEELYEFLTNLFKLPKSPGWTEENRAWWRQAVASYGERIAQVLKHREGMKQ